MASRLPRVSNTPEWITRQNGVQSTEDPGYWQVNNVTQSVNGDRMVVEWTPGENRFPILSEDVDMEDLCPLARESVSTPSEGTEEGPTSELADHDRLALKNHLPLALNNKPPSDGIRVKMFESSTEFFRWAYHRPHIHPIWQALYGGDNQRSFKWLCTKWIAEVDPPQGYGRGENAQREFIFFILLFS